MNDVVEINISKKVVEFVTSGRGPIGPAGQDGNKPYWGDVRGNIANQADLQAEFNTKIGRNQIAHTEETMVATQSYAVGDFISVGENLYRVITAITSGSAIVVNTNVVNTTIESEINDKVSLEYSDGYFSIG